MRTLPLSLRRAAETTGELSLLTWRAFVALVRPPYEVGAWISQAEQIGVRSLGVASITTVFTGMVLGLQTAYSLPSLGVKYYIGTVVGKSLTRELGPVLVALIVGGRIGAEGVADDRHPRVALGLFFRQEISAHRPGSPRGSETGSR